MDKLIAFGYYGGKYSHLDWLLPLLPTTGVTHYCEPFGGSAAVLLNREPSPVETYNDLDGELTNFFKVLREHKDALLDALTCTPFSRVEYALACQPAGNASELERARRLFVRIAQGYGQNPNATVGKWGYTILMSRNDMGGRVSSFYNRLDKLGAIAQRLLRVQLENEPAVRTIQRYDTPETLFYLDPPYTPDSCHVSYRHVMTLDDHAEFLTVLKACKGRIALSGYENPLYADMLSDWYRTPAPSKEIRFSHAKGTFRQEILWTNYDPLTINGIQQMAMFTD